MKRALLSVSDKTLIVSFAEALTDLGFEIVSTGGTYAALVKVGLPVINISDVTGFAECLDGRLKTLHPAIHGGILALRDSETHLKQIDDLHIFPIDIVAVNLYPFKQTIRADNVLWQDAVENIDIGGPAMLRAAAKNYRFVTALTDPADYMKIIDELKAAGKVSEETNLKMAAKVFMHTADYDAAIAAYWKEKAKLSKLPQTLTLTYEKAQDLRYGENPHQRAAFYKETRPPKGSLTDIIQLHGKELSFNNIHDTHGALELLREFDDTAVVAVKHANPCGAATGESIADAYRKVYAADPVSIYGGILAANAVIDEETASEIAKIFIEIVLAPDFTKKAFNILSKKKNIRLLRLDGIDKSRPTGELDFKRVSGGLLVQEIDSVLLADENAYRVVTKRAPARHEQDDLLFAWKIVKHVKSNGIAIAKNRRSLGLGPGQVNRIWAVRQAIEHAHEFLGADALAGASLASDAFFPFEDCVQAAAEAGISAIIQPGGSVNDQASIEACDKNNIAMLFTQMRHFRH